MKKVILTAFASLLMVSVAEADLKKKKGISPRKPASSDVGVYCGKMSIKKFSYVLRDGKINASIPQDFESGDHFAPAPGDSDPNSPSYRDHNMDVGKEKVWMSYPKDLMENPQLKDGSCICLAGYLTVIDGANVLQTLEGYAFRPQSKCQGIK